jgi:hypothetical protein
MGNTFKLGTAPQVTTNYIPKSNSNSFSNSLIFDNGTAIAIGNGLSSATPQLGLIEATDGSGTNIAGAELRLQGGQGTGTGAGGALTFYTSAAGSSGSSTNSALERMRITTAGNVGIGTNNPVGTLEIYKASSPYLRIIDGTRYLNAGVDGTSAFYNTNSSHRFYVQDGTNNALTIGSTGNVGIGTTNPLSKLSVGGDGYASRAITAIASGTDFGMTLQQNSTGGGLQIYANVASWGNIPMQIQTNSGYQFIITTAGLVGIGTGSPNGNLEVNAATPTIISGATSAGSFHGFEFRQNNTIDAFIKQLPQTGELKLSVGRNSSWGGNMTFFTDTLERMRITSGGSVCINRTSGSGELNVQGTIYLYLTSPGAGNSTLKYNTSTGQVTYDSSARAYKKDIEDLNYGLSEILQMSPKKYKYKSDNAEDIGFIADEMFEIVPEIVALANENVTNTEFKNGEPISINYDRLTPILVKAIQELSAKVSALENKS